MSTSNSQPTAYPPHRLPLKPVLMALSAACLLMGLWGGLARMGWLLPMTYSQFVSRFVSQHGALMLSGFLGALISLERAVAMAEAVETRWAYAAPALAGLGGLAISLGLPDIVGRSLIVAGSIGLIAIFGYIIKHRPDTAHGMMGAGAVLWAVGNGLWWLGAPAFEAVPWWIGFLLLTITGERLELGRVLRLPRRVHWLLLGLVAVFVAGLVISRIQFALGIQVCGAALIGLSLWLLRFDIARRTIRKIGLTRFIAACLLLGQIWLGVAGALWLWMAPQFNAGFGYDAMLHTVLVGFVFSMILGHAPVIVPGVLGRPFPYSPLLYAPLAVQHLALIVRLIGDATHHPGLRMWGGLFNEVAIMGFLALAAWLVLRHRPAASPINPAIPSTRAA